MIEMSRNTTEFKREKDFRLNGVKDAFYFPCNIMIFIITKAPIFIIEKIYVFSSKKFCRGTKFFFSYFSDCASRVVQKVFTCFTTRSTNEIYIIVFGVFCNRSCRSKRFIVRVSKDCDK